METSWFTRMVKFGDIARTVLSWLRRENPVLNVDGRTKTMHLTESFTTEELTVTETGLHNTPGQVELERLLHLSIYILQPARDKFGMIRVTSGYRSKQVNDRVGGSATSQHLEGSAADIVPLDADMEEVFEWIKNTLKYGQVIIEQKGEKRWIHVSLPRLAKENMMAMRYLNGVYQNV